jgi:hypothetical protein
MRLRVLAVLSVFLGRSAQNLNAYSPRLRVAIATSACDGRWLGRFIPDAHLVELLGDKALPCFSFFTRKGRKAIF